MQQPSAPSARGVLIATVVASAALVTSLVTSTFVASRAYVQRGEQSERRSRTLEVTGSARVRISSDLAMWSVRVAGEGKSIEEAYQRLAATSKDVQGFLGERGFGPEAVSLGAIDTHTHYRPDDKGRETREVTAYRLSRRIEVRSGDPGRVAQAAGEVTELLKTGAHVESGAPRYLYTKLADLKVRMIGEATANARERAERIAAESRCRIGAVKDARAGVLQITPPWSVDVSDSGLNDTSSIEKDVTAVMRLAFAIESAN